MVVIYSAHWFAGRSQVPAKGSGSFPPDQVKQNLGEGLRRLVPSRGSENTFSNQYICLLSHCSFLSYFVSSQREVISFSLIPTWYIELDL